MRIELARKGFAGLPANAVKSFANNALFFAKSVAGPILGQVCIERPVSRNRRTEPVRSAGRNVWLGGESPGRCRYRAHDGQGSSRFRWHWLVQRAGVSYDYPAAKRLQSQIGAVYLRLLFQKAA